MLLIRERKIAISNKRIRKDQVIKLINKSSSENNSKKWQLLWESIWVILIKTALFLNHNGLHDMIIDRLVEKSALENSQPNEVRQQKEHRVLVKQRKNLETVKFSPRITA